MANNKILFLIIASLISQTCAWAGPYSNEEFRATESSDETKIREIRSQEIEQLRIALGRRIPENRKAELYVRLAEAYFEAYRTNFLIEGKVHEERLKNGVSDTIVQRNLSKPWLKLAIQACQEILSFRIHHPKLDEVIYMLAYSHAELDQKKEALSFFARLTREFPKSSYASEAWREQAEAAYRARRYPEAIRLFKNALQNAHPEKTPRLLHRIAWSYYRLRQFSLAISTMKQAVEKAKSSGEKFLGVKDEALRDLAIFMTEAGKVNEAIAYFQEQSGGSEQLPRLLEKLGRQLERNVEYDQAIQAYETIIKIAPESASAFRAKARLFEIDLKKNRVAKAIRRIEGIQSPSSGDAETLQVESNLKALMRATATDSQKNYRKNKDIRLLVQSEQLYEGYLRIFLSRDDPRGEKPEIQMYLAEAKRDLKKNREASALYKEVVKSGHAQYSKQAASLWVTALSDVIQNREVKQQKELTQIEEDFVSAADDLADTAENLPEGREASLRVAQLLAGYPEKQNDAIKRLKKIVEKYPSTTQGVLAGRLWVQLLSDRMPKNMAEKTDSDQASDLNEAIEGVQKAPGLLEQDRKMGAKLAQSIQSQKQVLEVSQIANYEKSGNFTAAAKAYEVLAQRSSDPALYRKAYQNAAGAYQRSMDYEAVLRVASAWQARDSKSQLPQTLIRSAATHALITSHFDWSTKLFATLGYKYQDAEALETAAKISEGDGQVSAAEGLMTEYLKRFQKHPDAPVVEYRLARLADSNARTPVVIKYLKSCSRSRNDISFLCRVRLSEIYQSSGQISQARSVWNELVRVAPKKSAFLAFAQYQLGYLFEKNAQFTKLSLPEKNLQTGIEQRLKFLEKLAKIYDDALEAGGNWGLMALDRLAVWVESLADDLESVEPPRQAMTPEQTQKFKNTLKSLAQPLHQRALITWQKAFERSQRDVAFSSVIPSIHDRLVDAKVSGLFRSQGAHAKFRLSGSPQDESAPTRLISNTRNALGWVEYGNLLWFKGKPGLARVAYDQAVSIDSKNVGALNNRAVVGLMHRPGPTDPWNVFENSTILDRAHRMDNRSSVVNFNRASLMTYYRLFASAKPLWSQVLSDDTNGDAHDGLAACLASQGDSVGAQKNLKLAEEKGAASDRFVGKYLEAVIQIRQEPDEGKSCVSKMSELLENKISGFEKDSTERLKAWCAASQ